MLQWATLYLPLYIYERYCGFNFPPNPPTELQILLIIQPRISECSIWLKLPSTVSNGAIFVVDSKVNRDIERKIGDGVVPSLRDEGDKQKIERFKAILWGLILRGSKEERKHGFTYQVPTRVKIKYILLINFPVGSSCTKNIFST